MLEANSVKSEPGFPPTLLLIDPNSKTGTVAVLAARHQDQPARPDQLESNFPPRAAIETPLRQFLLTLQVLGRSLDSCSAPFQHQLPLRTGHGIFFGRCPSRPEAFLLFVFGTLPPSDLTPNQPVSTCPLFDPTHWIIAFAKALAVPRPVGDHICCSPITRLVRWGARRPSSEIPVLRWARRLRQSRSVSFSGSSRTEGKKKGKNRRSRKVAKQGFSATKVVALVDLRHHPILGGRAAHRQLSCHSRPPQSSRATSCPDTA
jgi:hypothetical protein